MKNRRLYIQYSNSSSCSEKDGREIITFEKLVQLAKSKRIFKFIWRYKTVEFHCPSFTAFPRPFLTAMICRILTYRECYWVDNDDNQLNIGFVELIKQFLIFLYENVTYKRMLKSVVLELEELDKKPIASLLHIDNTPVYYRGDLSYGYIAGGSLGHIAGICNNLLYCIDRNPIFISTDYIPTVREEIKQNIIKEKVPYGNVRDVSSIAFNKNSYQAIERILSDKSLSFVYQRSALNVYSGIKYALNHNLPFILEYNGSEVWISNKWGGRELKGGDISAQIEKLTFRKANLITCVSAPLRQQLIEMGIEAKKIIVNPNGVDTNMYNPNILGDCIKLRYGIPKDKIVIGFIGTYGAWHGAEVLAQAYVKLINEYGYGKIVHMLFIGDGVKMPEVKKYIVEGNVEKLCTFTGTVPQKEGPEYLAACDILVSPQIRNVDGTPFFGSPTKLFEYMAMGKAIVASNMDQLAEVCQNEKNALLVEPGNINELAAALKVLADNREQREQLGKNARQEVCEKYTWEMHTQKIIEALKEQLKECL